MKVLLALLILTGCGAEGSGDDPADAAWSGGEGDPSKADGWLTGRRYEVLLTDPHCDECDGADKAHLLERSPIIRRVVELIDGAVFTVDAAQFTFSRKEIEAALLRAHERGVQVRLAMDAGQDREGSLSRRLVAAGLPVRFVGGRTATGAGYTGLQHAKFVLVDGGLLATGSNNWSSTGTSINEENTLVVGGASADPLIQGFACHFEAIWAGDVEAAGGCSNAVVAFTPSSAPYKRIRNEIRAATRSVDVLMHHLKFDKLVKELAKAAERGVRIRVVVNEADRAEHTGSSWDRLFAAGGRIRFKRNNADAYQLMHHKLMIVDDALLVNGSGNWSGSAFFNNFENYVRYAHPAVVVPFVDLFARLWTWSRTGGAVDRSLTAAQQHAETTRHFFGNLHAHHAAREGDRLLDDGLPERLDPSGAVVPVDVGATHADALRHAYEYARDQGGLDFMALSPHTTEARTDDAADIPNMTLDGFQTMVAVAEQVTEESAGAFVALPSMEWSTNSSGNHVGILGSSSLCKTERGRFDALYEEFLPGQVAQGDRPVVMFNHPRTFRRHQEHLTGNWDQVFGAPLTDIPNSGQRTKKFNDYGLDDYPPMSEVRDSWIAGDALPDEAIVAQTQARIAEVSAPWARLMEVTVGRGKELGGEEPTNPSMTEDPEAPGVFTRYVKVHSDWDRNLLWGFRLAPVANHDNHRANWGKGHTTRTVAVAESLGGDALLDALRRRSVYASEDEDLALRMYADDRVPMGGAMRTLSGSVKLSIQVSDPGATGHDVRVFVGQVGGASVDVAATVQTTANAWHEVEAPLETPGSWFLYLEAHDPRADRMAWSAPIWVDRLAASTGPGG